MTENYSPPVSNLLTLGETDIHDTRSYFDMGFTREHIPELIRVVEDEDLHNMEWNKDGRPPPEVYAPIHAWRVLTQLGATEAIPSFLGLLHSIDDDNDDYVGEEIPRMLGKLGAPAIDPCRAYLADRSHETFARVAAGHALARIGEGHPETRDDCVRALMSTLEEYAEDDETVNAFSLSYLADLGAVEAAPLAEKIFEGDHAELEVAGDYQDFQIKVGLLEERLTEPDYGYLPDPLLRQMMTGEPREKKQVRQAEKKEKNKRKQAKKARKKHRRK